MTQQDQTQQSAAHQPPPGQPAVGQGTLPTSPGLPLPVTPDTARAGAAPAQPSQPAFPSPYLDAGQSVPQAYLAPPQPGQPSYGTLPGRPAAPSYGQPPQQSAGSAAGYGPGAQRPAFGLGAAARRDPALAAGWQRFLGSLLDWIIIDVLSVVAFWSPLQQVYREVEDITVRYQSMSSPAAQAAFNSVFRNSANEHAVQYWLLGMFGIALCYFWLQHAAWGATIGKRLVGTRVVHADGHGRVGIRAAGLRTLAFLAGPAVFMLLSAPLSLLGVLAWLADAGCCLLDPRAQTLHDKLARTVVVRRGALSPQPGPGTSQ